jgi:L-malate glycosyltransferase
VRVLLFSDADVFAGTERHMFDLANGLNASGVESAIASPDPSVLKDKCGAAGIKHIVIQKHGLIDKAAIKACAALLKSGEIDVIHAHNGRTMLSSALAVTVARKGRAVATQHFLQPDHAAQRGPRAAVFALAHRWVSSKLSHYVAISDAVRDAMVARNEAPASKVTTIHNGMPAINTQGFKGREAVRQELGIPPEALFVLCAARLEKEKDISTLVQAIAKLKGSSRPIYCASAGTGKLRDALEAEIKQAGIADSMRLLGFRDDVLNLMDACDLFVLPSLAEPFGLVLIEAMALGKPVICTNAGGPREIVENGVTGILTSPSNSDELANAIQSFVQNPAMLKQMGEAGYARYSREFTAKRMAEQMIQLYERVTGR